MVPKLGFQCRIFLTLVLNGERARCKLHRALSIKLFHRGIQIPQSQSVVHEDCEKQNDRKRNSEQPEQCTSTETHVSLHVL